MQEQTVQNVYVFIKDRPSSTEDELIHLLRLEFSWGIGVSNAGLRDLIQTTRRSIALEGE